MNLRIALLVPALLAAAIAPAACESSQRSTSAATSAAPTPDESLQRLMDGNNRFATGRSVHPNQSVSRREAVAGGQAPFAIILACADSRVGPEVVFDQGVGDIFVVRLAGNIADDAAIASMEFATSVLHAPLIVVMGHTECGAVKATIDTVASGQSLPGHLPTLTDAIRPSVTRLPSGTITLDSATAANVRDVAERIRQSHPILADLVARGKVRVVGGVYDLESGRFQLVDAAGRAG